MGLKQSEWADQGNRPSCHYRAKCCQVLVTNFHLLNVGSGRVAAVKWHLRHKLSDWLRRTFSFSHTHTDTPVHKHTPSILGTVGEIYSGNNLFVAQSDYKKRLRTFINYISYIQWNMVLYLNNCRRQLWYFDSLPRTNGFSPFLACWVDLSWWKPNLGCPFHRVLSWKMMKCFPSWVQSPRCGHLAHFERECQGNISTSSLLNNRLRS